MHTNGLENFWSLLKRSIRGTYVSVDLFHLFRYLDEQAFRFNARKGTDRERFVDVLRSILGKRLTYAQLISDDMTPLRREAKSWPKLRRDRRKKQHRSTPK